MIALDDEQLACLMTLAQPVPAARRAEFVAAVVAEAGRRGEIGVGILHRVGIEMRKTFATTRIAVAHQPAGRTLQHARRR